MQSFLDLYKHLVSCAKVIHMSTEKYAQVFNNEQIQYFLEVEEFMTFFTFAFLEGMF